MFPVVAAEIKYDTGGKVTEKGKTQDIYCREEHTFEFRRERERENG